MFVPPTVNVKLLPSFTLDAAGVIVYVGVRLVSMIVIKGLIATTGPAVEPVLIRIANT